MFNDSALLIDIKPLRRGDMLGLVVNNFLWSHSYQLASQQYFETISTGSSLFDYFNAVSLDNLQSNMNRVNDTQRFNLFLSLKFYMFYVPSILIKLFNFLIIYFSIKVEFSVVNDITIIIIIITDCFFIFI